MRRATPECRLRLSQPGAGEPARRGRDRARQVLAEGGLSRRAEALVSRADHRPVEDRPEGGTTPVGEPQRRLSVGSVGGGARE